MELWLDSADPVAVKKIIPYGFLSGITTNPELLRSSKNVKETLTSLLDTYDETMVAVQVASGSAEDMIAQGKALNEFSDRIIVKVPVTTQGLKAIHALSLENIFTMGTCVFSSEQALFAAQAGADYVALYLGRLEKAGGSAEELLENTNLIFLNYDYSCRILAASIQDKAQFDLCAKIGIDAVTLKEDFFHDLLKTNPLTEEALKQFEGAYKAEDASLFIPRNLA